MPARVISPNAGFPFTSRTTDAKNRLAYDVDFSALTPGCVKFIDAVMELWFGALCLCGALLFFMVSFKVVPMAIIAATGLFAYYTVLGLLHLICRVRTHVTLTIDEVVTRTFLFWNLHYDRKLGSFALISHDLVIHEQRAHELAQAEAAHRGKVLRKKPVYGDSYHVIWMNGSQRVTVATIYGVKKARAVLHRLQYLDATLDAVARAGNGNVDTTDDDWLNEPGGLS